MADDEVCCLRAALAQAEAEARKYVELEKKYYIAVHSRDAVAQLLREKLARIEVLEKELATLHASIDARAVDHLMEGHSKQASAQRMEDTYSLDEDSRELLVPLDMDVDGSKEEALIKVLGMHMDDLSRIAADVDTIVFHAYKADSSKGAGNFVRICTTRDRLPKLAETLRKFYSICSKGEEILDYLETH